MNLKSMNEAHLPIIIAEFKKNLLSGRVKWKTKASENVLKENKDMCKEFQSDLNEAQVRQSFILPLIQCLGWNTEDPFEVFPEERINGGYIDIKVRTSNGNTIIWEIKRPGIDLELTSEDGREAAYQGIGYARTFNSFPYTVITNFESFFIYHSYQLPSKNSIHKNLIASFDWIDISIGKAKSILELLSKYSLENGETKQKFDELVQNKAALRTARPLHLSILDELESWRLSLANEFYKTLTSNIDLLKIDNAVQILINRFLLIRCSEDRKLESNSYLEILLSKNNVWKELVNKVFPYFRESYNSDLFKENDLIDDAKLKISDEVIKNIIEGASGRYDRYDFSIIPLEILGVSYEQYLAKYLVIKNGDLKLEIKPELKKAGGICYTPTYIVEAIVKDTLDNQKKIKSTKIFNPKILDPACGSGTFLITAFSYLCQLNSKKSQKKSQMSEVLTLDEKKKLLKECIFGVDLDPRAIEITKLSLMLKLLEGEQQGSLVKQAILPHLEHNIRHGNSLIEPRDLANHNTLENSYRLHPLSWQQLLKRINSEKGFDVIIGNPPYVRSQVLREFYPEETKIYTEKYKTATDGNVDIYIPFIERSINLLNSSGIIGFITPHRFWTNDYGKLIRQQIEKNKLLSSVINFRAEQVFNGVSTYTCIFTLQKKRRDNFDYIEAAENTLPEEIVAKRNSNNNVIFKSKLPMNVLKESHWLLAPLEIREKILQIETQPKCLSDYIDDNRGVFQGLITGNDDCFLIEKVTSEANVYFSSLLNKKINLEPDLLKPTLKGSSGLRQLKNPETTLYMLFPYFMNKNTITLYDEKEFAKKFPLAWKYLKECETSLRSRSALKTAKQRSKELEEFPDKFFDGKWFYIDSDFFKFSRNQALDCVTKSKLIVPSMFKSPTFFWDKNGEFSLTGSGSGGGGAYAMFLKKNNPVFVYSLIGILSSKLIKNWFERRGDLFRGYYIGVDKDVLLKTPLPDLENLKIKNKLAEISSLVQALIEMGDKNDTRSELIDSIESIVEEIYQF